MTQPNSGPADGAPGVALTAALDRLVADGTLTAAQAKAVRREVRVQLRRGPLPDAAGAPAGTGGPGPADAATPGLRSPWTLLLAEVGGYVGGAFVLGAAALLLSHSWHQLHTTARVVALAVPAVLVIVAAVITARTAPGGWRPAAQREPAPGVAPRRRLVSMLAGTAAALGGGVGAVLADARHASDDWTAVAFAWPTLLIALAAYLLCRSELLHTVLGVAVAEAAVASLRVGGWYGERPTAWAFIALGVGWAVATLRGLLTERGLGFGWGGVLVFVGGELLTTRDPSVIGYAVLTLLVVAGLAGFTWGRSLTLLVIGVATLAVLVPQAVIEATDGGLSTSAALLVVGLSIVGASALGFRLHRTPPAA